MPREGTIDAHDDHCLGSGDDLATVVGRRAGWGAVDEDDIQEAVIRYWLRLVDGQHVRCPPAWVSVVAANLARSRSRRQRAETLAL